MKKIQDILIAANESCTFNEVKKTRGIRITNKCARIPICYYCNYMAEPVYNMTVEETVDKVKELKSKGVDRITLVSGWLGYQNTMAIPYIKKLKEEISNLTISGAFGPISKTSLKELRAAGLDQYGCNLESVPEILVKIKGTDDIPERRQTLENAREVGLKISTGFIIGIGENENQLRRLLRTIKKIDPESVFMTPFEPYQGTQMSNCSAPSIKQIVETIAKTRLTFTDKTIGLRIIRQGSFIPIEFLNLAVFAGVNLIAPPPDILDMSSEYFLKQLMMDIQNLDETCQHLLQAGITKEEIADFKKLLYGLHL